MSTHGLPPASHPLMRRRIGQHARQIALMMPRQDTHPVNACNRLGTAVDEDGASAPPDTPLIREGHPQPTATVSRLSAQLSPAGTCVIHKQKYQCQGYPETHKSCLFWLAQILLVRILRLTSSQSRGDRDLALPHLRWTGRTRGMFLASSRLRTDWIPAQTWTALSPAPKGRASTSARNTASRGRVSGAMLRTPRPSCA